MTTHNATTSITKIKSTSPKILSKNLQLDVNGNITSTPCAQMSDGEFEIIEFQNLHEFSDILNSLNSDNALTYGIPKNLQNGRIFSQKQFEKLGGPYDAICRKKDYFKWPESAGILMIDYDPSKNKNPLTQNELIETISTVIPLPEIGYVWTVSSSSMIFNKQTNKQIAGIKGQRIYVWVKDASDIERAGKVLFDRLWLAQHGWFDISKSGTKLIRSVIDASVWQATRLDFAAGAVCSEPLEQRKPLHIINDCAPLDTKSILLDLSADERAQLSKLREFKWSEQEQKANQIKTEYIEKRAHEIAGGDNNILESYRKSVLNAINNNTLSSDFYIKLDDGKNVSIKTILEHPQKYDGRECFDPIEPDYSNNRVVAKIFLKKKPNYINSFAHGGRKFMLVDPPKERIQVAKGSMSDSIDETLLALRNNPHFFDRFDGSMIRIKNNQITILEEQNLTYELSKFIQYYRVIGGKTPTEEDIDPPTKLVKQVISLKHDRKLKLLNTFITAPTITPEFEIISEEGYNSKNKIYLALNNEIKIPDFKSIEEVKSAINWLMKPFNLFPFENSTDRAVMLAALMTAVVRPTLDTAPIIAFDATARGAGKTLLAVCISSLSNGSKQPAIFSHIKGNYAEDEIRKRLTSSLIGGETAIVWDNIVDQFDSPTIAALTTSATFTDRILGKSSNTKLINRMLFCITGNNLILSGDLIRRTIVCRLNPETETPFSRNFAYNPEHIIFKNRLDYVARIIGIIKAYKKLDGKHRGNGKLASFEQFDTLVRQVICWINSEIQPGVYADILDQITERQYQDPENELLMDFLNSLQSVYQTNIFTARDLYQHTKFSQEDNISLAIKTWLQGKEANPQSIGLILKRHVGVILDNLSLNVIKNLKKGNRYFIKQNVQVS